MTDGVMLASGAGRRIVGGGLDATLKVAGDHPALMSTFEMIIPAGYDVGAHVHAHGEEVFYVVEGELDVLAFDPVDRSVPDWYHWESASGQRYLHGGPGAFMFVPENVPHAFANRTTTPTKIFFQSSVPGGHENYFEELAALLRRSNGKPDQKDITDLRRRYDIEQLTALRRDLHAPHPPAPPGAQA
jgi:mannose-6-phosphate isomerase-like protein (cupin superfamily)